MIPLAHNSNLEERVESEEYILFVTEGIPELKAAALYLQENLERLIKTEKIYPKALVLNVPDVSSAIHAYYNNPLDVALIIAQKKGQNASGSRIAYLLDSFDRPSLTKVIDPYILRNLQAPMSLGRRAAKVNPEQLAQTVALYFMEMRERSRKPIYDLPKEERSRLIHERKSAIDSILLEDGNYIIHGAEKYMLDFLNDFDLSMLIEYIMRPLILGDIDTATSRWFRIKNQMGAINLHGIVTFGADQSIAGGYKVADLTKPENQNGIFGLKAAPNYEDAVTFKIASDFHNRLAEEASRNSQTARGKLRQIWRSAKINVPNVLGVLSDDEKGIVFMEYRGLSIYPINILSKDYPDILQELLDYQKKVSERGKLASQLLDATFVAASRGLGFWRANPYMSAPHPDFADERQRYYEGREAQFFKDIKLLGVNLTDAQLERVTSFFHWLNSNLKLRPEDAALRMDMRLEHLGYYIKDKVLPTAEDAISAAQIGNDGKIDLLKAGELLVIYDAGGSKTYVPLHHEVSHLKEHPLLMWSDAQTLRYVAIILASQQMSEALRGKHNVLKWHETLKEIIETQPNNFSLQDAVRYFPVLASFGPNESIIDIYRDFEEGRQILAMRLPRLYISQERILFDEKRVLLDEAIATRTKQFQHYASRALHHLSATIPTYILIPETQKSNYDFIRGTLEQVLSIKEMPKGKIMASWDGF